MDWTRAIDVYCERLGPGFWAEPVNALTNAAFLVAAAMAWRAARGLSLGRALAAILAAIGVGSFLFHTFATPWAAALDTTPILVFILLYLYGANRVFCGWPVWGALLGTAAFLPYAFLAGRMFGALPVFEVSAGYWPVPLLIAGYAAAFRRSDPWLARGLLAGALVLAGSLVFRTLDGPACDAVPVGTHFLWHILNATMLGGMVVLLSRAARRREARLAGREGAR